MIAELVYLCLGVGIGYALTDKARRKALMAKLNDWTKPKGKEPEAKT